MASSVCFPGLKENIVEERSTGGFVARAKSLDSTIGKNDGRLLSFLMPTRPYKRGMNISAGVAERPLHDSSMENRSLSECGETVSAEKLRVHVAQTGNNATILTAKMIA